MDEPDDRGERSRRGIRAAAALSWVSLLLAASPVGAGAATTCDFDSVLDTLTVAGDPQRGTQLRVSGSGEILVYHLDPNGISIVTCTSGTPTVTNTDTVAVTHAQVGDSDVLSVVDPDAFAPGVTDETLGMFDLADEIEITVDLGQTGSDTLSLNGTAFVDDDDAIVLGDDGVNWNPADPIDDRDIVTDDFPKIDFYDVSLVGGTNSFTAQGAQATGEAIETPIKVDGGDAVDRITGGDGPDTIETSGGRDSVKGEAGNDDLTGGDGPDGLRGGAGHDRLFAKDGKRDRRIDCGPGAADGAAVDGKDPAPVSC